MKKVLNVYGIMSDKNIADKKRLDKMEIKNLTPDIITIDEDLEIYPLKFGTARIQVKLETFINEIVLYVRPCLADVTIVPETITAFLNDSINILDKLTITGVLTDGTPAPPSVLQHPTYINGDRTMLEVINDTVIGKDLGTATLTLKFSDLEVDRAVSKTINIEIIKNVLSELIFVDALGEPITNIFIIKEGLSRDIYIKGKMLRGEVVDLTTEQLNNIEFISADNSIASIDHFIAKGYKEGNIPVTAWLGEICGSVNFIVTPSTRPVIDLTLDHLYKLGDAIPVMAIIHASDFEVYKLYWKITNVAGITVQEGTGIPDWFILNEAGEYMFTQYGEYFDNTGVQVISSSKELLCPAPLEITVEYSTEEYTDENVIATMISSRGIIVLNNNGLNTHTFTTNGVFTFQVQDPILGTTQDVVAIVTKIVLPLTLTIGYNHIGSAEDVVATLNSNRPVTILNNSGNQDHYFDTNGSFTYQVRDELLHEDRNITATVNWITKLNLRIEYVADSVYGPVTAKVKSDRYITVINNGGSNIYNFIDNGTFTFEVSDTLTGETKFITATVINIEPPLLADIIFSPDSSIENPAVGDIAVSLVANKPITMLSASLSTTGDVNDAEYEYYGAVDHFIATSKQIENNHPGYYGFRGVAQVKFVYRDNYTGVTFTKTREILGPLPTLEIVTSNRDDTYQPGYSKTHKAITCTVEINRANSQVTANTDSLYTHGNYGSNGIFYATYIHVFTENGTHTFEFTDDLTGAIVSKTFIVDSITVAPVVSISYEPDCSASKLVIGDVLVSLVTDKPLTVQRAYTLTTSKIDYVDYPSTEKGAVNSFIFSPETEHIDSRYSWEWVSTKFYYIDNETGDHVTKERELQGAYSKLKIISVTDDAAYNSGYTKTNNPITFTVQLNRNEYVTGNVPIDGAEKARHTFTQNGSFTFEFTDTISGEKITQIVNATTIIKAPVLSIVLTPTDEITNMIAPISAELITDIPVTLNSVKFIPYGLTEVCLTKGYVVSIPDNGKVTYNYTDDTGAAGSISKVIANIFRPLTFGITYSSQATVYSPVFAILTIGRLGTAHSNNKFTVLNPEVTYDPIANKYMYIFIKNGTFTFDVRDDVSLEINHVVATVSSIVSTPIASIEFTPGANVVGENVIAKLIVDKAFTITNNSQGTTLNDLIITTNGTVSFTYVDTETGISRTITKLCDFIYAPLYVNANDAIIYSPNTTTYGNVKATLNLSRGSYTVMNNAGLNDYTFTGNGYFTFTIKDNIDGTVYFVTATVDWMYVKPNAVIEFTPDTNTINPVVAKLIVDKPITIVSNSKGDLSDTITLTANGTVSFTYKDNETLVEFTITKACSLIYPPLTYTVTPSISTWTEDPVLFTINTNRNSTINFADGKLYTFTKSEEIFAKIIDNITHETIMIPLKVDWILTKPVFTFTPSEAYPTEVASLKVLITSDVPVEFFNADKTPMLDDTMVFTSSGTKTFYYKHIGVVGSPFFVGSHTVSATQMYKPLTLTVSSGLSFEKDTITIYVTTNNRTTTTPSEVTAMTSGFTAKTGFTNLFAFSQGLYDPLLENVNSLVISVKDNIFNKIVTTTLDITPYKIATTTSQFDSVVYVDYIKGDTLIINGASAGGPNRNGVIVPFVDGYAKATVESHSYYGPLPLEIRMYEKYAERDSDGVFTGKTIVRNFFSEKA